MSELNGIRSSAMIAAIFLAALCFSFAVLNRWAVTDLGLLSYGRVWQLYVSYADFGFFRRGFIGSLFSETGLNSIVSNEYVFAFAAHHVAIALLTLLTGYFCVREKLANPLFLVGIAFSPALIIHSAYTTGSLDVFVLLLVLVNILYVRNVFLFSAIVIAGVFTHELFIFTLPAQVWALICCREADKSEAFRPSDYVPIACAIVAILIVVFFGRAGVSEQQFEETMRAHIPNAFEQHPFWSGYFETSSSVTRSLNSMIELGEIFRNGRVVFLIPSMLYLVFLTFRVVQYVSGRGEATFVIAAIAAPLLTSLLATDFYRWVAMSANVALFLTLRLAAREGYSTSKWNIPIALFCLLAPFGAADLERPFPLHQFVIENFL